MEKYLLVCKSESGNIYHFKSDKIPTKREFEKFVKENMPEEYDEELDKTYVYLYYYLDISKVESINF